MSAERSPPPSLPPTVPFPRLEPLLQKFVKVAVPTDVRRLDKHRLNVERLCRLCEWDRLHQEQVNARRTVQQLLTNVREVEKLRELVEPGDGLVFERAVRPARREARLTVTLLLTLGGGAPVCRVEGIGAEQGLRRRSSGERMFASCPSPSEWWDSGEHADHSERLSISSPSAGQPRPQSLPMSMLEAGPREEGDAPRPPLPERPHVHAASESWSSLRLDLEELLEMLHDKDVHFPSGILRRGAGGGGAPDEARRPPRAGEADGTRDLAMVAAAWPVAGALIGGVVAGPLGFLTGMKVAAIAAAISGGLIGFTGGTIIQKWKERRREKRRQREQQQQQAREKWD